LKRKKWDPSNKKFETNFEEKKNEILELCTRFAIYSTNIFSEDELKLIPYADKKKLNEEELEKILDCGFFSGQFDNLKFIHRSFAEFLIALYIVAKYIYSSVYMNQFTVIQTFINFSPRINEFGKNLITINFGKVGEAYTENLFRILEGACHYKFQNIFASLTIATIENEDYKDCLRRYFIDKSKNVFVSYLITFDDSEVKLFEKIVGAYGVELMKTFLKLDELLVKCHELNIPKILKWINENTDTSETDYRFVKNILKGNLCKCIIQLIQNYLFRHFTRTSIKLIEEILMELDRFCSKYENIGLADEIASFISTIQSDKIQFSTLSKENFEQIWVIVQKHNCSKILKACLKLCLSYIYYGFVIKKEFSVETLRYVVDRLDKQFSGKKNTKPSMEILEILAMKKILETSVKQEGYGFI
jgi:hypothetical protein